MMTTDLSEFNFLKKLVKLDKRIQIYKNKKNLNFFSKSRNIGIKKS